MGCTTTSALGNSFVTREGAAGRCVIHDVRLIWDEKATKLNKSFKLEEFVVAEQPEVLRAARKLHDTLHCPPDVASLRPKSPVRSAATAPAEHAFGVANFSKGNGKRKTFGGGKGKGKGKKAETPVEKVLPWMRGGDGNTSAGKKARVQCYKCGEFGHFADKCPAKWCVGTPT